MSTEVDEKTDEQTNEKTDEDSKPGTPHIFCGVCKYLAGAHAQPGVFTALCGEISVSNGGKFKDGIVPQGFCEACTEIHLRRKPKRCNHYV
jgi:hypothetical protein